MSRPVAYVVGLGLAVAVAMPAFRDPPRDSFPLSTYPMFSTKREQPVLEQAVAVGRDGTRVPVAPQWVASDEVMQAAVTVRQAVWQGPAATAALCHSIARRAAGSADHAHVTRIEIVSARYDPILYFSEGPEPIERVLRRACPVTRGAKAQ
jgi:hypothetical protein